MPLALDILNEIADRLGWPQIKTIESQNLSSETRKLLNLLNRVLGSLGGQSDFPMLRADGTLVLVADVVSDVTSGSEQYVTATQNSTTVTVANMTFDSTYEQRAFQVGGDNYVYRIASVTSATVIELNRAWIAASITVSDEKTFVAGTDRYALPSNFDRPTEDFAAFLAPYNVLPVSPEEFQQRRRDRNANQLEVGEVEVYTIYGMNEAQTSELIHFDPFPGDARLLNFLYLTTHPEIDSDNDKILYPKRIIEVIIEMILQLAYRDYEDDVRMQQTLSDMLLNYNQLVGNKGVTGSKRIMEPSGRTRMDIYRAYRSGGGNVDWGSAFDRAGNVGFF